MKIKTELQIEWNTIIFEILEIFMKYDDRLMTYCYTFFFRHQGSSISPPFLILGNIFAKNALFYLTKN